MNALNSIPAGIIGGSIGTAQARHDGMRSGTVTVDYTDAIVYSPAWSACGVIRSVNVATRVSLTGGRSVNAIRMQSPAVVSHHGT